MGVGRGSGKLFGLDAGGSDWRDWRGDETRDGDRDGHGDRVVTLEGTESRRIPALPLYERHVFVCHNVRPADAPRPSCTRDGTSDLHSRLQQLSRDAGLGGKVRINKSGCLDQCEHGPTVVVYPEAVWYGNVRPEDAAEIVTEHLVGGRPVERLRIAEECINSKTCPHRS